MEFQDTDSILAELEQEQQGQESKVEPQESSEPDKPFVTINYKGEQIPMNQSQTVEYAQKGRDYETKMSEYKKLNEEFQTKSSKFQNWEERNARVEEINQAYVDDPKKLEYLLNQYENIKSGVPAEGTDLDGTETYNKMIALEKTVDDLKGGYQALKEDREANLASKIQTEVMRDFDKMKKEHDYLDWTTKDSDGLMLDDFILKYATDNNIHSIETATLQFAKDQIFANLIEKGKKEAVENSKENNKKGIKGVTAIPQTKSKPIATDTSKSFDDLAKEALAEIEAGVY